MRYEKKSLILIAFSFESSFVGWVKHFVDEMVGYVLDFRDDELLNLIHNSLRNPPFTWLVELHPTYAYLFSKSLKQFHNARECKGIIVQ